MGWATNEVYQVLLHVEVVAYVAGQKEQPFPHTTETKRHSVSCYIVVLLY